MDVIALECFGGVPLVQGAEKFFDASGLRPCTFQGTFGWKWSRANFQRPVHSHSLNIHSVCVIGWHPRHTNWYAQPPPESHAVLVSLNTPQVDLKVRDMTKQRVMEQLGHDEARLCPSLPYTRVKVDCTTPKRCKDCFGRAINQSMRVALNTFQWGKAISPISCRFFSPRKCKAPSFSEAQVPGLWNTFESSAARILEKA